MAVVSVDNYTKRIREVVNRPRKQNLLLKNRGLFDQMCASFDAIEDLELAVDAYSNGDYGSSTGAFYLTVYGLLQALVVQQDAVFNLCRSLGISPDRNSCQRLQGIRDIRIKTAGHPTKRDRVKPTSYHFISRMTLTPASFELWSVYGDGTSESQSVFLPDLVANQRDCVSEILNLVVSKLEGEEAAHKEKFRMEKLASLLPDTLEYMCGKVFEGLRGSPTEARIGVAGIEEVKGKLKAFKEALALRGEVHAYEGYRHRSELDYVIVELDKFLVSKTNAVESNMTDMAAYIFAFFLHAQISELRQMAESLDQYYSS